MAVRSIAGVSPVTNSMVVTTPVGSSNYTTERLGEAANVRRAQPFIAKNAYLSRVTFRKGDETGTFVGTVKVSIQASTAGDPSGTDLVSFTYTNAQWIALTGDVDVTLTLRTPLTVGDTYFIVFTSSTSDNSNYTRRYGHRNTTADEAGLPKIFGGVSWSTTACDALYFKITSGPAYYTELARTPISTPRTTTTSRVATRDMGTALRFDGVNDKVQFTPITANVFSGEATFDIYVKRSATGDMCLFGSDQISFKFIQWQGNGRIVMETNTNNDAATSNAVNIDFNPHRFTVVANLGVVSMYCDGRSLTMIDTSVTNDVTIDRVGIASTALPFNGIIDEPRIWNRALSAQEVADMYFNNTIPRTGLVAEYLFNETTGTTALDSSGNGNNGTITGATYTTDVPLRVRTNT